ncbi:MAG: hypothetical protein NC824_03935 [Candidatus Omnitrophica bacterium]|nr:hypothetical protein [Candidatus Omnitrophota bacterium]
MPKKDKKENKFAMSFPFLVDSVAIPRKDILNYIKGKSQPILGDDYYYAYIYQNGVLFFVSVSSKNYLVGKIPSIAVALLHEGNYFYKVDNVYYFIERTFDSIKTTVGYQPKEGYINLEEVQEISEKIPKTLHFKWSLKPSVNMFLYVSISVFVVSVSFILFSLFKNISNAEKNIPKCTPVLIETKREVLPDVAKIIDSLAREIEGKGYIEKVELVGDNLEFKIKFIDESYIQSFVSQRGGKIEKDTVVYLYKMQK